MTRFPSLHRFALGAALACFLLSSTEAQADVFNMGGTISGGTIDSCRAEHKNH